MNKDKYKAMKIKSKEKAFTLLELLVVMAIMAILTVIGIRSFGTVQQKSRDSHRKQDMQNISKALELYYNDYKRYPYSSLDGKIEGCGVGALQTCEWGDVWQNSSNQTLYMSELPVDLGGNQYFYLADSQGRSFSIFTYLENTEDDNVVRDVEDNPAYYSGTSCRIVNGALTADSCNYVLMSSNTITKPAVVDGN
jgi:prepilin-type N-terminal cleavage/methylation domain-containing protein